ncbi:MAG: citrate synthase [Thermoleophilia bacterium]|nr:citrate synthase [Thermoleophilia bacterium]
MATDSLTVTDNRTGQTFEVPIKNGTVRAMDFRQMKIDDDDFGLMAYDPAFTNTVSCSSEITFLDGDAGVLQYRGYPIEQLAEKSTFTEVAYLLIYGKLPTASELDAWNSRLSELMASEPVLKTITEDFPKGAHPMGITQATVAALGTLYPDSKDFEDDAASLQYAKRLIAQMAVLGAWAYRHGAGLPLLDAPTGVSYPSAFLQMMFGEEPDPLIERALDVLLILHADHEQNCSTSTVRVVGSSDADVHASVSSGVGALYGPLHGGANEAVLQMLARIGTKDKVPAFIGRVKNRDELLMGFGHRVYKNFDPRATIIKKAVDDVFAVTGVNPLLEVAQELERIALEDEFFVGRKLYPNVDFYSGLLYEALGIPTEMFTVMFAIGRTPGWVAQWWEMKHDEEQKIARPRQVYTGGRDLEYIEVASR